MAPVDSASLEKWLDRLQTELPFISSQLSATQHLIESSDSDVSAQLELYLVLQKEKEYIQERIKEVERRLRQAIQRERAEMLLPCLNELSNQDVITVLQVLGLLDPLLQESYDNICRWLATFPPQIYDRLWHLRRCHLEEKRMYMDEMERFI
jgi:hypothetical protein